MGELNCPLKNTVEAAFDDWWISEFAFLFQCTKDKLSIGAKQLTNKKISILIIRQTG